MRRDNTIAVIIPALNEELSIGHVLGAIPNWVDDVVVADNGSTDNTAAVAEAHNARVVHEPQRGYGAACLTGIAALRGSDIVVFLDGDFSDYPQEMASLVDPIISDKADLVIGSRVLGRHEPGALTPQARFGNRLACFLMRLFWGQRYTDLGPFRAIRRNTLESLDMRDRDYGWTVEMQIKAARQGVRAIEAPVQYRRRIGKSKVSGTLRGVVGAGTKILSTIFFAALLPRTAPPNVLAIFTRYPQPGRTKTRLIPALGADGAAQLQREMTEHALEVARAFADTTQTAIEVRFVDGTRPKMQDWLGDGPVYRKQGPGDLGRRMQRTFEQAFRSGTQRLVLIGSDCPDISVEILSHAFNLLEHNDLVLGPATDGGYYLIGLRRETGQTLPALFDDMPWGADTVLEHTLARAQRHALATAQVATLSDIDRPEDLH